MSEQPENQPEEPYTAVSLSEIRQLGQRAVSYSVPIVSPCGMIATGTLFKVAGAHVLVSAAHNSFNDGEDRKQIRLPSGRRVVLRGSMLYFQPEGGVDPDVVAYRLKQQTVDELDDAFPALTLDDVVAPKDELLDCLLLAGFTAEKVTKTGQYTADWFLTSRYTGSTRYLAEPYEEETHLMLAFNKEATSLTGPGSLSQAKAVPAPAMYGVSGSAVWTATSALAENAPGELWDPAKRLKVIAVQTSVGTNSNWIRSTLWSQVAGLLIRLVPNAADEIRDRYGWEGGVGPHVIEG